MTAIDIGEAQPSAGILSRIKEWRRRRRQRRAQPDVTKTLDQLNERLLRDMGYEPAAGFRKRDSAWLWMGRTPPGRYNR